MWFVYFLECADGSVYTGVTNDVARRFREHREGHGGRYTRSHKPVKVLGTETFRSKPAALRRELQIKGWRREKKLAIIKSKLPA